MSVEWRGLLWQCLAAIVRKLKAVHLNEVDGEGVSLLQPKYTDAVSMFVFVLRDRR